MGETSNRVMNRWAKLLAWLVAVPIVLMVLLFLAAVAFWMVMPTGGTYELRRAAGEQLLGSARGSARVAMAKAGEGAVIRRLTGDYTQGGSGMKPSELEGKYYRLRDEIEITPDGGIITCDPIASQHDGVGRHHFRWDSGGGQFEWEPYKRPMPWDP